jgi:hypothetical protein
MTCVSKYDKQENSCNSYALNWARMLFVSLGIRLGQDGKIFDLHQLVVISWIMIVRKANSSADCHVRKRLQTRWKGLNRQSSNIKFSPSKISSHNTDFIIQKTLLSFSSWWRRYFQQKHDYVIDVLIIPTPFPKKN